MMRAVIFLCLGAAQARLLIKSKTVTPVTEKVTVGGPGAATDVGSDVTYNECFDFTTSVPPIVTVCVPPQRLQCTCVVAVRLTTSTMRRLGPAIRPKPRTHACQSMAQLKLQDG